MAKFPLAKRARARINSRPGKPCAPRSSCALSQLGSQWRAELARLRPEISVPSICAPVRCDCAVPRVPSWLAGHSWPSTDSGATCLAKPLACQAYRCSTKLLSPTFMHKLDDVDKSREELLLAFKRYPAALQRHFPDSPSRLPTVSRHLWSSRSGQLLDRPPARPLKQTIPY